MSLVMESELRHGTVPVGDYRSTSEELLDLLRRPGWQADALCREYPKVHWFGVSDKGSSAAKAVCERCLVRQECLAYAMADPNLEGIWGGLTRRERNHLRKNPVVRMPGPNLLDMHEVRLPEAA